MIAEGIIDPAKVTRSALQNAASIAALFLTTEAVVADKPEKAPAMPAAATWAAWAAWTSDRLIGAAAPPARTTSRAPASGGGPAACPGCAAPRPGMDQWPRFPAPNRDPLMMFSAGSEVLL